MNREKMQILDNYLKAGISTILLEDIKSNAFETAVVLEADCDISLLNGHYEGLDFVAPTWYKELIEKSKKDFPILIINNINKVSKEEQKKFIEILKYKKISTFDLPKETIIIATCSNLQENKVDEEVYSLMAHI